jgi:hypothetical protein
VDNCTLSDAQEFYLCSERHNNWAFVVATLASWNARAFSEVGDRPTFPPSQREFILSYFLALQLPAFGDVASPARYKNLPDVAGGLEIYIKGQWHGHFFPLIALATSPPGSEDLIHVGGMISFNRT